MEDSILAVRFYKREVINEFLSEKEGRPIAYMADYVRIEIPGNMTSVIDTVVHADHKKRFPIEWARFQNENDSHDEIAGTPLKEWSILTQAQAMELRHVKFYTVEQVAAASDQQLGAIGMMVGMSPMSLRDKAKAYLAQAKDSSTAMMQAEELRKKDQQIADLQAEMARIAALVEKKPVGRPKKETEEA